MTPSLPQIWVHIAPCTAYLSGFGFRDHFPNRDHTTVVVMPAPSDLSMCHVTPNPTDTLLFKESPLTNLYFLCGGVESKLTEQWWLPLQVF